MPDFDKSRTVEKIDVSSANNLVRETRFSGRSLMYIKKGGDQEQSLVEHQH